jgi:hypothetical protein
MYLIPQTAFVLLKVNFMFYSFWGYFVFLLLLLLKGLESSRSFTFKMDCDGFIGPN